MFFLLFTDDSYVLSALSLLVKYTKKATNCFSSPTELIHYFWYFSYCI